MCLFGFFFWWGGHGSLWWGLGRDQIQKDSPSMWSMSLPHLPKKMLRPRACFHSTSGTYESSPETLIITPKVCYVQKHLSLCKCASRECVRHANRPVDVLLQCKTGNPETSPRWEVPKPRASSWAQWQIKWPGYVPQQLTCQFLKATMAVKVTSFMCFLSTKKSILSLCFPCCQGLAEGGEQSV